MITEVFETFKEVLGKVSFFVMWVVVGVLVLPCVYVATVYYPMWEKWGEDF